MCALYNTGRESDSFPIISSLVTDNGVVLVSYTLYAIMSSTDRIVCSSRSLIFQGNDDKRRRRFRKGTYRQCVGEGGGWMRPRRSQRITNDIRSKMAL